MARRLIQLGLLVAGVVAALAVGSAITSHFEEPGPIEAVRAATRAYAAGDCGALRRVSESPSQVDCADVAGVRDAYRDEGLDPDTFAYDVKYRGDEVATVQISYERGGRPSQETVHLERHDGHWKVALVVNVG